MSTFKRALACVLSASMLLSTLPSMAFAAEVAKTNPATATTPYAETEPAVDAVKDAVYDNAGVIEPVLQEGGAFAEPEGFSMKTYTAYSGTKLYIFTEVIDPNVAMFENAQSFSDAKKGERIKYNFDFTNIHNNGELIDANKGAQIAGFRGLNLNTALTGSEYHFDPVIGEDASCNIASIDDGAIVYEYTITEDGYHVELSIDTAGIHYKDGSTAAIVPGQKIGFDTVAQDKATVGGGANKYSWHGTDLSWDFPAYNGTLILEDAVGSVAGATITVNGKPATVLNSDYAIEPLADYDLQNPQKSDRIMNKMGDVYKANFTNGIIMTDGKFTTDVQSGELVKRIDLPNALFNDQNDDADDWTLSFTFTPLTDFDNGSYTTILSTDAGSHYILRAYNKAEENNVPSFRLCFNNANGGTDDMTCRVPYGEGGVEFVKGQTYTITMVQSGSVANIYVDGKVAIKDANVPFNLCGAGTGARYMLGGAFKINDPGANVVWESVRFYADALDAEQVKTVVAEQTGCAGGVAYTTEDLEGATIEATGLNGATATVDGTTVEVIAADGTLRHYKVVQATSIDNAIKFDNYIEWSGEGLKTESNAGKVNATGTNVGGTYSGAWIKYAAVDFGMGANAVEALYCNNSGRCRSDAWLDFRIDALTGPSIAKLYIPATADNWDVYGTASVKFNKFVMGVHDVFVVMGDDGANTGNPYIANLDSFSFDNEYMFGWSAEDSAERTASIWHYPNDRTTRGDNGKLVMVDSSRSKVSAGHLGWRNYVYEATMYVNDSTDGDNKSGVMVRVSTVGDGADAYRGYYFGISATAYEIGKANGGWTGLKTGEINITPNEEHKITVKCYENKMRLYVDDVYVDDVVDTEHKFGGIGFRSFNNPTEYSSATVRAITQDEIDNEFLSGVAEIDSIKAFNATTTVDHEAATVKVEFLKNSEKAIKVVAKDNGTAVVSEDGATITVTSENGKATKEYAVTYSEVESLNMLRDEDKDKTWDAAAINGGWELLSQYNYLNLDPTKTYKLTAKIKFDLTNVAADASDDTLVVGNGPCIHNLSNAEAEVAFGNGGAWSMGMFRYYMTGGIYTLGMIKNATPDENGFINVDTIINPTTFAFDSSVFGEAGMKIQARLEGLGIINGMSYFTREEGWDLEVLEEGYAFTAPEGITATFGGYELRVISSDATLASVKVGGVDATIDEAAKTVAVELPYGSDAATAAIVAVANSDAATVTVAEDRKSIAVVAEDGTTAEYTLAITVAAKPATPPTSDKPTNKPTVNNPTNGTTKVNGKTVLYKNGKAVTGTQVVTVSGKTYAVVKGYVATGKATRVVTVGKKSYVVSKAGIVQKGKKNKLIKVSSKKSYIVNKSGVIQKSKKNKLVKVGSKSYIVNKKGIVQKNNKKNMLVKVGKKKYVVSKKGVVYKKKTVKVGKKTYKTNKKGVATLKKK